MLFVAKVSNVMLIRVTAVLQQSVILLLSFNYLFINFIIIIHLFLLFLGAISFESQGFCSLKVFRT